MKNLASDSDLEICQVNSSRSLNTTKDLRINYFHSVLYTHIMSSGTPI